MENQLTEYKSLKKIKGGSADFTDLAKTCVCFANSQGGEIIIGIEDKEKFPPKDQKIDQADANNTVTRLRTLCFNVGISCTDILEGENGGEYFIIKIFPSLKSIATTSDGKIYLRVGDQCQSARSEDLFRLASEKDAFQWELVSLKSDLFKDIDEYSINWFASQIRRSERVKNHVQQFSDIEICEHYNLINSGFLTNLGVLWLGNAIQRSRIAYPSYGLLFF